jgi:hypothetical protein
MEEEDTSRMTIPEEGQHLEGIPKRQRDATSKSLPLRSDGGSRPPREETPGGRINAEHDETPPETSSEEDLEGIRRALEAKQKKLLAKQEIRRLRERIEVLERQETKPHSQGDRCRSGDELEPERIIQMSSQGNDDIADGQTTRETVNPRKRNVSEAAKLPPPKSQRMVLKPSSMSPYHGKNESEHRQWVREAETKFRQSPPYFATDADKILFTMESLRGEPANLWFPYETEHPVTEGGTTWEDYKKYLLDIVKDPMNRQLDDAQAYQDAKQRQGQTAQSFHSYLQTLESRLPPYTEEQLITNFLTKLLETTRKAILDVQAQPKTRLGMVALAQRMENNRRPAKSSRPTEQPKKGKEAQGPASTTRTSNAGPAYTRSAEPRTREREGLTCYNCGGSHLKRNCPSLKDKSANQTAVSLVEGSSKN